MTITEQYKKMVEDFRKAYREQYEDILPEEYLEDGNKWFENFLTQSILSLLRAEVESLEGAKLGYGKPQKIMQTMKLHTILR